MMGIEGMTFINGNKAWYLKKQKFGKETKLIRIRIKNKKVIDEIKTTGFYNGIRAIII